MEKKKKKYSENIFKCIRSLTASGVPSANTPISRYKMRRNEKCNFYSSRGIPRNVCTKFRCVARKTDPKNWSTQGSTRREKVGLILEPSHYGVRNISYLNPNKGNISRWFFGYFYPGILHTTCAIRSMFRNFSLNFFLFISFHQISGVPRDRVVRESPDIWRKKENCHS